MKTLITNWQSKLMFAALTTGVFLFGANASAVAQENWGRDEGRAQYKIGDKVQFSVSGKAADFQTCTVTENDSQSVMRVKCNTFKQWKADTYMVYNEENVRPTKTQPTKENNQNTKPTKPTDSSSTGLKIGEYACYGSGGSILAGLGFKVLSGNRYTDLEGGNPGTFVIAGDMVKFRGGHLGGQSGRELQGYNFRIGAQASYEPF